MQTIGDMPCTGRRIPGPGSSLIEVEHDDVRHTVIVFEGLHRGHRSLNADLEVGMGFMTDPQVTGLVRLVRHLPDDGAFVYPTGTVWSIAEIVRELADVGEVGGVKAGLELCYLVGEILVEAADQSVHSNLAGHGSIDPWRVLLKADGQVAIVGYGLPRLEVELYLDDENRLPTEDSLRYCAPENLRAGAEPDLSSDLFSLALVALELMVGRPVYDGLVADVRNQAARAEAGRRLYQWRDKLPETVREVLGKALKPDPDIRFRDGLDFVYGVHDLLGGIDAGDGPSLREIVSRVRARQKRGNAVMGGNTGALTRAELAELAADIDNEGEATDLPPPRQARPEKAAEPDGDKPRWRRATRSRGAETTEQPSRRRRGRSAEPPPSEGESARDRLLRRLKERSDGDSKPMRRRRPSAVSEDTTSPTEVHQPPPDVLAQKKRRRRGGRGAALLERLRSTSGGYTPDTVDPTVDDDDEATVVTDQPVLPAASASYGATASSEPTLTEAPRRLNARLREPEPDDTAADDTPVDVEPDPDDVEETVVGGAVPRELLQAPPRDLATITPSVRVAHEGREVELPWRGPALTAATAAQQLGLPSTDLFGTLVSAFWLRRDGTPLPPDGATDRAELFVIPNRPLAWNLRAPHGETSILVGAAVSVGALNRALGAVVGIDGPVVLERNGQPLHESMPAGLVPSGSLGVRPGGSR